MRQPILITFLLSVIAIQSSVSGQEKGQDKKEVNPSDRAVIIKLQTGEELRGNLVKVDGETAVYTVNGVIRSVGLDVVEGITFLAKESAKGQQQDEVLAMTATLRPVIL